MSADPVAPGTFTPDERRKAWDNTRRLCETAHTNNPGDPDAALTAMRATLAAVRDDWKRYETLADRERADAAED